MEKETKNQGTRSGRIIIVILIILCLITAALLFVTSFEKRKLQDQEEGEKGKPAASEEIEIRLPETIYATAGIPLEIYNSRITSLGDEIKKYNIRWNCEVGENLERRYSLQPTSEMAGEYPLTCEIYDNELKMLAKRSCTLKIADSSLSEDLEVLKVTDSLNFPKETEGKDAVCIFLKVDNSRDGKENGERILRGIEQLRDSGTDLPVYVGILFTSEENADTFEWMESFYRELSSYEKVYTVPLGICADQENFEETGSQQILEQFRMTIYATIG